MKQIEEIRINEHYTSKLVAEYKYDDKKRADSEAKVRHTLMRTTEYIKKFVGQFNPQSIELSLTPPNCRFLKTYPNGYTIAVVEEPPAMRTIRVQMDMTRDAESLKSKNQWKEFGYEKFFTENSKPYTFMLAVPYVIHILQFAGTSFSRGKVFFRPRSLLGVKDVLYKPPLLNINNDMTVCYGDGSSNGPRSSIAAEIDHMIRIFWSATFNPDYIDNYYAYTDIAGVCDYFTWQYYSQTDPMFIYNVDWIPTKQTVDGYIKKMEQNILGKSEQGFGFKTLSQVFDKPQVSSKMVSVGKRRSSTRPLVYDICNGWFPEERLSVYVGDPIKYTKDRIAFIDCFAGVLNRSEPLYVRIKLDDKLLMMRINDKTKRFFAENIKSIRHEAFIELPDKTKLAPGDIITMQNNYGNEVYKKIHYIRKASDGALEMRVGSEYWFVDMIEWEKVKKLDVSNPEVDGVIVKPGEEYYYYTPGYYTPAPLGTITTVKFDQLTIGDNNSLIVRFYEDHGNRQNYTVNISRASKIKRIYEKSECEEMPDIFFIGRCIFSFTNTQTPQSDKAVRHKDYGVLASQYERRNSRPSFDAICKQFLSEDEQHFHAKSNNIDIDFSVEDKVVVADWKNPLNVLSIKTIKAFVKNKDQSKLSMMLEDKNGTASTVDYVQAYESVIMVGKVRKVTNELNGITIGTKIVAKQTGISCFPKKDVNIIVAFIVDTGGEPLALCSNGCTLWFTDLMEKFELTKIKSPQWKKMAHAPLDPTKIKLQPGDVINGTGMHSNSRGYLVVKNSALGGIRFVRLDYYHDYDEYTEARAGFVKSLILDCIPNPRMTNPKQKEIGLVRGFPTFHGGINRTIGRHSPYKFIDETGRF